MLAELVDGVAAGVVVHAERFFRKPRKPRRRHRADLRRELVRIAGEHDRCGGVCILLVESYELFRLTQQEEARAVGRPAPKTRVVHVPRSLRRFVQGRREIETLR